MPRFVEATVKTPEGDEEYFAMPEKMADKIKARRQAQSQFHTKCW